MTPATAYGQGIAWALVWDGGSAVPLHVTTSVTTGVSASWPAYPGGAYPGVAPYFSPWRIMVAAPGSGVGSSGGEGDAWFPAAFWPHWGSSSAVGPPLTRVTGTASAFDTTTGTITDGSGAGGADVWCAMTLGFG